MRGKGIQSKWSRRSCRITPAYAGKSYFHENNQHKNQDHPRLCGEKIQRKVKILQFLGSPPPMRGKGRFFVVFLTCVGITPAYAGKSGD